MNETKKNFLKNAVKTSVGVVSPSIKTLTSLGKSAIDSYPKIKNTLASLKEKVGNKVESAKTGIAKGLVKSLGNTPAGNTLKTGLQNQGRLPVSSSEIQADKKVNIPSVPKSNSIYKMPIKK